jgi:hypothetical protein
LRDTAAYLNAAGARVVYGGRVFNLAPDLRKRIPAYFLGETIQEAIQSTETLLSSDIPLKGIQPLDEQELKLSQLFLHNRTMIDTYALTGTGQLGIPIEFSIIAIQQMGNNLASALSLGQIEALAIEMEWVKGLLQEHLRSAASLDDFLAAYAKSVDSVMGDEGRTISAWLREQAGRSNS